MRAVCLFMFWSLLLYSCKEVSFREPQPVGVPPLTEVPKSLRGHYTGIDDKGNDTDTLIIESWGYRFRDSKGNEWLGRGVISDSLVLKYYQNYYFVNFRSGNQWVLRLIKQKPSGSIDFLSINLEDESRRTNILKNLAKSVPIKEVHRKNDVFYEIEPSREQLMKWVKEGLFTGTELSKVK